MGYRIEYGTGTSDGVFRKIESSKKRMWIAIMAVTIIFILCYSQRSKLLDFILPGDPDVTKEAIGVFINDLKEGERASDAFSAFCKVIIDGAQIY